VSSGRWLALALGVALARPATTSAETRLPARYAKAPYSKMSLSIGHPNAGAQVRAKKLKSKRGVRILPRHRENVYGHPALVLMIERSAKQIARRFPGSVLSVGDMSSKDGGPLAGHHSHQSGRDVDLAFYARDAKGRPAELDRLVAFDGSGKATDGSGLVFDDERNWALVEAWAQDSRADIAYVFISRPLKARLLAFGAKTERGKKLMPMVQALFMQPDNAEPHDDHFHVRIRCPKDQADICKENPK
jgi:penicillin-insensitive murein endopeptidase